MTEYIIIVALIAIGTIVVVTAFGDNIRALFGAAANALAGQSTEQVGETIDDQALKKNLGNFAQDAGAESP